MPMFKNIVLAVLLCFLLSTELYADSTNELAKQAAGLKPFTQQLKESKVGKWLSVWGNYSLSLVHSSLDQGAYTISSPQLITSLASTSRASRQDTSHTSSLQLGLRSNPVKPLTLDISMSYSSDLAKMSDLVEYRNFHLHRGYVTLEVMDKRLKLAAGRRPLGDSVPLSLLQNRDQVDQRGNPSLLETLHFDGVTLSYAPENLSLLGSHWRISYGYGYDEGYDIGTDSNNDGQLLAIALVPVNLDNVVTWFQWVRRFELFDSGDIDWFSAGGRGNVKLGPGNLHGFADFGISVTRPGGSSYATATFTGLLSGVSGVSYRPQNQTGYAVYTGFRYDLPTLTKIGFEYNYGSKYWVATVGDATSKAGTRGHVYEPYIIQEISLNPVTTIFARTFLRVGYRYHDYYVNESTSTSNWVGAPASISSITSAMPSSFSTVSPASNSYSVYGALEVHF